MSNSLREKTLASPLDCCKEIQPVHSEGDQPWDFFGGNDAKADKKKKSPLFLTISNLSLFFFSLKSLNIGVAQFQHRYSFLGPVNKFMSINKIDLKH